MVYKRSKPDSGKSPKRDAPNIQGNFSTFDTVFSQNHTPLNDIHQGDHETIIFQNQTDFPGTVVNGDFIFAHNATSKADTQPQLFVKIPKFLPTRFDSNTPRNDAMQFTFNTVDTAGPNQYQSFLIGCYLINFGIVTGSSTGLIDVTVTLVPAPTKILSVIATTSSFWTNTTDITRNRPYSIRIIPNTTTNASFRITSTGNIFSNANNPYEFRWVAITQA